MDKHKYDMSAEALADEGHRKKVSDHARAIGTKVFADEVESYVSATHGEDPTGLIKVLEGLRIVTELDLKAPTEGDGKSDDKTYTGKPVNSNATKNRKPEPVSDKVAPKSEVSRIPASVAVVLFDEDDDAMTLEYNAQTDEVSVTYPQLGADWDPQTVEAFKNHAYVMGKKIAETRAMLHVLDTLSTLADTVDMEGAR